MKIYICTQPRHEAKAIKKITSLYPYGSISGQLGQLTDRTNLPLLVTVNYNMKGYSSPYKNCNYIAEQAKNDNNLSVSIQWDWLATWGTFSPTYPPHDQGGADPFSDPVYLVSLAGTMANPGASEHASLIRSSRGSVKLASTGVEVMNNNHFKGGKDNIRCNYMAYVEYIYPAFDHDIATPTRSTLTFQLRAVSGDFYGLKKSDPPLTVYLYPYQRPPSQVAP